mmetsp:Transcript_22099/g.43494  ORF Transcript_22099/g.43494 Transcript_22099/m.43494 type:complete len:384 (+) Transcript_22099:280-1431(+)
MGVSATESAGICAKLGVMEVLGVLVMLLGLALTILAPDMDMPTAPDLAGDASASSITLMWNAPLSGCYTEICKYELEMAKVHVVHSRSGQAKKAEWYAVEKGLVEFKPRTLLKHTVENLEANQPYQFRVRHWVADLENPGSKGGKWGPFSKSSGRIFTEQTRRDARARSKNQSRRMVIDWNGKLHRLRSSIVSFLWGTVHMSLVTMHLSLVCVLFGFVALLTESYVPILEFFNRVFSIPKFIVICRTALLILILALVEPLVSTTNIMGPLLYGATTVANVSAVVASGGLAISLLWWHCSRFEWWGFSNAPSFFVGVCFFSGVYWRLAKPLVARNFHAESSPQTVTLLMYLLWLSAVFAIVLIVSLSTRTFYGALSERKGIMSR